MVSPTASASERAISFRHPVAFWTGVLLCAAGVGLHLPMYLSTRSMGYRMAGMTPDAPMIVGMLAIGVGLVLSLYGLIPARATAIGREFKRLRVDVLDDTPLRLRHVALLVAMSIAVTIDVMKPTALTFVSPGVAAEYGLKSVANPHAAIPVAWLPLVGITGTMLGSFLWGALGDRIGRRASILYAGILFISTSICGAMPGFGWNVLMCALMGIGAGGMLPIAFALIAETIPARHRGWLIVLIGGNAASAYALTSWLAGALTPEFSWRILWLIGLPTGLLLIAMNRWIPESPRFLLATGRRAAAEAVMRRFGARIVPQAVAEPSAPAGASGFRDLFRKPFLGISVGVTGLAIAVGLLTYGFQFWVPTNLQHLGMAAVTSDYVLRDSALLGLPLTALTALLYGFWNSRRTVVILAGLTGLSVLVFAVVGNAAVHDKFPLSALLIVPLSGISSLVAAVIAYGSEVYPTKVRSRGTGWVAGMSKAGGVAILALVVAAVTTPSITETALLGAIPLLAATVLFGLTAPNTGGRRLEQIVPAQPRPLEQAA